MYSVTQSHRPWHGYTGKWGLRQRLLTVLLIPFLWLGAWQTATGEGLNEIRDYELKSVYIYNILKFIEWPEERMMHDAIRLCVVGGDPFFGTLDRLTERQAQGRPIELRYMENRELPGDCDLLVIADREAVKLPHILQRIDYSSIVTVSDISGFTRRGGMIGFVSDEDRIKLEINIDKLRSANIKINADLLELATIIGKGGDARP